MRIRDLRPDDIPYIEQWHSESGFDYKLPDFDSPIFPVARVVVDEDDRPVQLVACRKTVEIFFLGDSEWRNPRWRLEALTQLHEDVRRELERLGYEDGHCWPPPQVEKSFGKRLSRLFGWVKSDWASYSRKVRL